jgi:hypothetical protein
MDFEGHHFRDLPELEAALRASWPGVWVEAREGGDALPFTWALRLGDQHAEWQEGVVAALAVLARDPDDGLAFGALEALRAAPWDVGVALARSVGGLLPVYAARRSPRHDPLTGVSALADVVELLARSAAREAMPPSLGKELLGWTRREDGFPETAWLALALLDDVRQEAALALLVAWFSEAEGVREAVAAVLAQGERPSERFAAALRRLRGDLAGAFAAEAQALIAEGAAALEASLARADLPPSLKARMATRRGSHARRWESLAAALGCDPGGGAR